MLPVIKVITVNNIPNGNSDLLTKSFILNFHTKKIKELIPRIKYVKRESIAQGT